MAVTPEQLQQFIAGLATQPELMKMLKTTMGLESTVKNFHPKTFSRMEKFTGVESQWPEWVFNLVMKIKTVDKEVGKAMERIMLQSGTIIEKEVVKQIVNNEQLELKYGAELFSILLELTGGEANSVVRGVINKGMDHCGFCSFYALNQRFNPKTPARTLQFLHQVINPPKVKDIRLLPKAIEDWEARKSKLRTEFGETSSENL